MVWIGLFVDHVPYNNDWYSMLPATILVTIGPFIGGAMQ